MINLADISLPQSESDLRFLCRYRSYDPNNPELTEQILVGNKLYMASALSFNDPFDCQIEMDFEATLEEKKRDLMQLFDKMAPHLSRKEKKLEIKRILKEGLLDKADYLQTLYSMTTSFNEAVGTLCLSEVPDSILMWSHYADCHRGYCLIFEATAYTPFFGYAQKVNYSRAYPYVNHYRHTPRQQVDALFLTKSENWAYEKEWRIINYDNGPGLYSFPEDKLLGVILGCQINDDARGAIIGMCSKRKTKPTTFQAKKKKGEFALAFEEIA